MMQITLWRVNVLGRYASYRRILRVCAIEDRGLIRAAHPDDAASIAHLYNHYIASSTATFETEALSAEALAERLAEVQQAGLPWLVDQEADTLRGYAYAAVWKPRAAYRHTVESTVYVDPVAGGAGIGTGLYQALIHELRTRSIHVVMSVLTLPNAASIALHEKLGFEKVGHLREVGRKFDSWLDVGLWQLMLDQGDAC